MRESKTDELINGDSASQGVLINVTTGCRSAIPPHKQTCDKRDINRLEAMLQDGAVTALEEVTEWCALQLGQELDGKLSAELARLQRLCALGSSISSESLKDLISLVASDFRTIADNMLAGETSLQSEQTQLRLWIKAGKDTACTIYRGSKKLITLDELGRAGVKHTVSTHVDVTSPEVTSAPSNSVLHERIDNTSCNENQDLAPPAQVPTANESDNLVTFRRKEIPLGESYDEISQRSQSSTMTGKSNLMGQASPARVVDESQRINLLLSESISTVPS